MGGREKSQQVARWRAARVGFVVETPGREAARSWAEVGRRTGGGEKLPQRGGTARTQWLGEGAGGGAGGDAWALRARGGTQRV